jgi:hypothetical protein
MMFYTGWAHLEPSAKQGKSEMSQSLRREGMVGRGEDGQGFSPVSSREGGW